MTHNQGMRGTSFSCVFCASLQPGLPHPSPAFILRPMSSEGANAFIARWAAAGASERANSQPFLCELCNMLGVARPEPMREAGYAFEYDVTKHHPDGFFRSRVAGPSRFWRLPLPNG